jgi:hypothetical protein
MSNTVLVQVGKRGVLMLPKELREEHQRALGRPSGLSTSSE